MIITPKRNILQRVANRALRRFGMVPFPVAFESNLPEAGGDPNAVFNAVYASNYWGSAESKSGPGSELAATAHYREQLIAAIKELEIASIFDAPCGDLNWMPEVVDRSHVRYSGGDIAKEAVETARRKQPDLPVTLFDICADEFPSVDLWHCRDTFFHLSFADIRRALVRAKSAGIKYAAITTHRAWMLRNLDIKTGGYRLLDLERAPFSFGKPIRFLKDHKRGEFPRYVGIWRMSDVLTERSDPPER